MTDKDREFYTIAWRCLINFVIAFAKWQGFYLEVETKRGDKRIVSE